MKIYLSACNGATTSYTFPTAFVNVPGVFPQQGATALPASLVSAISATGVTITTAAATTGWIILDGF